MPLLIRCVFFLFLFGIFSHVLHAQDSAYVRQLQLELPAAKTDSQKIRILNELSWELNLIDADTAIHYAQRALNLAKGRFIAEEATSYNRLGAAYDLQGNYDASMDNFNKSYLLRMQLQDTAGAASVLINMGASYYYRGVYAKALEYYVAASKIQEQIKDNKGLSKTLNNISLIYRVKKDYTNALSYLRQSLQIKKSLNDRVGEMNTLSNIGIIYQSAGDCDSAIQYATQTYQLALELNREYDIASSLANMGEAYFCARKYSDAIKYFKQAEQRLLQNNDINTLAFCYKGMGAVYNALNNPNAAKESYTTALTYATQAGRQELISEIHYALFLLYKSGGSDHEALHHFELYNAYKDSLFSIEKTRQLEELGTVYETEKKQKQIDLLTQQNIIKEQQAENNVLQRNFFILVSAFALVLIMSVLLILRQKVKSSKLLQVQNVKIEQSLSEKETLLREIHHRVKNNLQIITGLLELQESLHDNKEIGNLVSEAQGRIKSMSLIHEMLYQTSDLSRIDLHDYVQKLVVGIETGFNTGNRLVQKNIAIENVQLHIDTIIPLGLILNELVSNAYKYVFSRNIGSKLNIRIEQQDNASWVLIVQDDGPGLPKDESKLREGSFGLKLVKMLSRQLKGKLDYENNNGAKFSITFKEVYGS